MPDTYGRDFTITVTFWPRQDPAMVVLAGDLDIDAWPDLTDAIGQLIAMPAGAPSPSTSKPFSTSGPSCRTFWPESAKPSPPPPRSPCRAPRLWPASFWP